MGFSAGCTINWYRCWADALLSLIFVSHAKYAWPLWSGGKILSQKKHCRAAVTL